MSHAMPKARALPPTSAMAAAESVPDTPDGGDWVVIEGRGPRPAAGRRCPASHGEGKEQVREQVVRLQVQGMMCGGCVATVRRVLSEVPLVIHTTVEMDAGTGVGRACVWGPAPLADSAETLCEAVRTLVDSRPKSSTNH